MSAKVKTPKIFCAFDTGDLDEAVTWAKAMSDAGCGIKAGMQFFNAHGPHGIEKLVKAAPDAALFIDLKYHDIPNTVAGAVRSICSHFTPMYLNIHATGGRAMMEAAQEACPSDTQLLAVTILTSMDQDALNGIGMTDSPHNQVVRLAKLTQESGLAGVVCSAHEIVSLRAACGDEFVLMVPGIRPEGSANADQKRVMTPKQAVQEGATHIVIGRPITQSVDPEAAAHEIVASLS